MKTVIYVVLLWIHSAAASELNDLKLVVKYIYIYYIIFLTFWQEGKTDSEQRYLKVRLSLRSIRSSCFRSSIIMHRHALRLKTRD